MYKIQENYKLVKVDEATWIKAKKEIPDDVALAKYRKSQLFKKPPF